MNRPQCLPVPMPAALCAAFQADLVALHGQAVNCAAMARWYAQRGNWPAARRKAVQWAPQGIRLNVVAPGAVETPLHQAAKDDARFGKAVREFVAPLGRSGTPEELARVVAFMQSQQASFMTGSVVFVDGGMDAMVRTQRF